jgi:hypothetical protein
MEPVPVEQATEIKTRHEQEWLKRPGVTGVDVGYRMVDGKPTKDVVIRVYVQDASKASGIPAQAEGVPIVVIERRYGLQ